MGNTNVSSNFQPSWWNDQVHGSAWERVKAAMQRDWEQTKNDFTPGAPDLRQDVDDTIKQATGNAPIPPPGVPAPASKGEVKAEIEASNKAVKEEIENRKKGIVDPSMGELGTIRTGRAAWSEVEAPVAYGFAAKDHYSNRYKSWDVELEKELQGEWDSKNKERPWSSVRDHVRTGYDAKRN
ncbi:MAG TPA: hypothetical protein VGF99_21690 [Myxococcota bacterium]